MADETPLIRPKNGNSKKDKKVNFAGVATKF